ncbi:MAG: hypothetical protein LC732_09410 [Acidobacteria bacterium]|nr:hypothetical protein [Acidobacteriota bacterium]
MAYQAIGPQQSSAGIQMRVVDGLEAATQTYLAGAALIRNAAGFFEEAGADPAAIYGFAAQDGSNAAAAGTPIGVYRPVRDSQFDGVLKVAALTQTMVGETAGLAKGADDIWYVDQTVVNKTINIEGYSSRTAIGDTDPVMEFSVIGTTLQEI